MAVPFVRRKTMKKIALLGALALTMTGSAFAQGRLFAIDSSRNIYDVDMMTGAASQIGQISSNAGTTGGLAYDFSTGTMYLTSTSLDSLYTLDINTGAATLVGEYGDSGIVMHGLEWDSSTGTLYGASGGGTTAGNFYTINTSTGVATFVGNNGLTSFTNLGYDSANDAMYATNSGADSFYSVDRATGAATLIGPLLNSTNPNGLAFNASNGLMYMVDNSTDLLYTMNLQTGEANVVGALGSGNYLGLVWIPTPGAAALLGLGGLAAARRRR
jgi:hypothetical protein